MEMDVDIGSVYLRAIYPVCALSHRSGIKNLEDTIGIAHGLICNQLSRSDSFTVGACHREGIWRRDQDEIGEVLPEARATDCVLFDSFMWPVAQTLYPQKPILRQG